MVGLPQVPFPLVLRGQANDLLRVPLFCVSAIFFRPRYSCNDQDGQCAIDAERLASRTHGTLGEHAHCLLACCLVSQ